MEGYRITINFASRIEADMFADRLQQLRDEFIKTHATEPVGPIYLLDVDEALLNN